MTPDVLNLDAPLGDEAAYHPLTRAEMGGRGSYVEELVAGIPGGGPSALSTKVGRTGSHADQ
ncbi:MAG TPA: hypothetical protein VFH58_13400 [Acidimicrobiales bacterium]|nr:hypothetical protein [Acidimicrobiales bacterium]